MQILWYEVFWGAGQACCEILVSLVHQPGIEPRLLAVKVQGSNYGITREFPTIVIFKNSHSIYERKPEKI